MDASPNRARRTVLGVILAGPLGPAFGAGGGGHEGDGPDVGAQLQIENQGLPGLAFPGINADESLDAQFANENDIHAGFRAVVAYLNVNQSLRPRRIQRRSACR